MKTRRTTAAVVAAVVVAAAACSAGKGSAFNGDDGGSGGGDGSAGASTLGGGPAANGGADASGGSGGEFVVPGDDTTTDDSSMVMMNACQSPCGPKELCDDDHLGYDDDCNGAVDETCGCVAGQAHWCFAGDPSFRFAGDCKDGTEVCDELGLFGPCIGGHQAIPPENCQKPAAGSGCVDITTAPFAKVNLASGSSTFATDADAGSSQYVVTCPAGVTSCPTPDATGFFTPLQSGQYGVTYSKTVGGVAETCNFSVFVGGGGLRIELSWDNDGIESDAGNIKGPDLDLHVHKPGSTTPWKIGDDAQPDDCFYGDCKVGDYNTATPDGPDWFSADPSAPPPHDWTLSPTLKNNSCYFAPRGLGGGWEALGKGCHNPRLDLDNFGCDATVTDPTSAEFCAPENVNLDEVPDGAFFRVGVNYTGTCTKTLPTHPTLRVYCAGGQAGELGPSGYDAPVTFTTDDCGKTFWVAADIYVRQGTCSVSCTVLPVFADSASKKPLFITRDQTQNQFGPTYPPVPAPLASDRKLPHAGKDEYIARGMNIRRCTAVKVPRPLAAALPTRRAVGAHTAGQPLRLAAGSSWMWPSSVVLGGFS